MERQLEEKAKETQSEDFVSTPSSQNDSYLSYLTQLQDEEEAEKNKEIEEKNEDIERRFNELLEEITKETLQVSEFLREAKKLTDELCGLLTQILKQLKISFNIPPKYIPKLGEAKQVRLDAEGHLIITGDHNQVKKKFLGEYSSDVVLTVIWLIVPELNKAIKDYRKKMTRRINLLEKIKHELKNMQKALSPIEGLETPQSTEVDKDSSASKDQKSFQFSES